MPTTTDILGRINPFNSSANGLDQLSLPSGFISATEQIRAALSQDITCQHVKFKPNLGPLGQVIDLSEAIDLHVIGFGSLAERFSVEALGKLLKTHPGLKINLTATDIYSESSEFRGQTRGDWLQGLRDRYDVQFSYVTRSEYDRRLRDSRPHIVMIATPPTNHYEDLLALSEQLTPNTETIIGIEKPFIHLEAWHQASKLIQQSTHQIYDVDFFNQGKAFLWLMTSTQGQEILARFGKPIVINGNCIETMTEWRDWMFEQSKSGGGAFVDCGSHNVNMMYVFMHHLLSSSDSIPHDFGSPQISQAFFGEYHGKSSSRETYSLLQIAWKDLVWNVQNGKALPTTAYNLEAISKTGSYLLVSVGTEFHPPFVLFADSTGKAELYTLDGPGVGYEQIFERMIVLAKDARIPTFPDPEASRKGSFDVLLTLEQQVRALQQQPMVHYPIVKEIHNRSWPGGTCHLPVTPDAFGRIKKLPKL